MGKVYYKQAKQRGGLNDHRIVGLLPAFGVTQTYSKNKAMQTGLITPTFVISLNLTGPMRKVTGFWAHASPRAPLIVWAGQLGLVSLPSLFKPNIPSFTFCLIEFQPFWTFILWLDLQSHWRTLFFPIPNPDSEFKILWLSGTIQGD